MKKYIFVLLLFFIINNKSYSTTVFPKSSKIIKNLNRINAVLNDELLQKLTSALSSIYKSNKINFKNFKVAKNNDEILFNGIFTLYRIDLKLEVVFNKNKDITSITGRLKSSQPFSGRQFKKLTKGNSSLQNWFPDAIKNNILFDNFVIGFDESSKKPSSITVSIKPIINCSLLKNSGLKFSNVTGTLVNSKLIGTPQIKASLTGAFQFGQTTISSTASVGNSSESWAFKGELEDLKLANIIESVVGKIAGLPMPNKVINIGVKKASFTVIPKTRKLLLFGAGDIEGTEIGELQLNIEPKDSSKLGFMVGISPSSDFKMANLDSNLKILDDLKITNFGLVLSSHSTSKSKLKIFEKLGGTSDIGRGFNFIGAFDLSKTSLYKLVKVKNVMVRAVVSNKLSDLLLEGALNTNIVLVKNSLTFKKVLFRIKPSPSNFKISMGGQLEAKIDKDVLIFSAEMGVDLTDQAIFVTGLMKGKWQNPFGAKGLAIADLGATFGVSFRTTPIPLPELGFKGTLQIKDFNGDMFVYLNTNNPSESAIDVGFDKVSIKAILEEFCDKQTLQKIPLEIRNTILDISVKDARLTVAARPLTIMEKDIDPGFRIKGTAKIGDLAGAKLDVQVGYDGIDASAGIEKISHYPFFALTGSRGREDPIIHIVAKASSESKVLISGSATLLGATSETDLLINDKGFDLYMNTRIFDVFNAKLEVTGGKVKDKESFRVAATLEQDFMKYLTENASKEIDKATKKTQQDITKAQNIISKEQKKLNALNRNITDMRNTVRAERKRDLDNIKKARQSILDSKKKHFNDINNNIKSINRKINKAHADIANKKKEIGRTSNIINKAKLAAEFSIYSGKKLAYIAAQETAKRAQLIYLKPAKLALKAAEESVKLTHTLGSKTPIDADPRIVALIGSKETANAVMEAGKGVLEAAKIVGVGTLDAAKWIVENGPTSVVNVTFAKFEAKLEAAHGGSISVQMKGTFAGKPMNENFVINFKDPLKSVKDFANSLL